MIYQILFKGETCSPINQATALRRLAALYQVERSSLEALFTGEEYCLKESADYAEIKAYEKIYRELGLIVAIVEYTIEPEIEGEQSQQKLRDDEESRAEEHLIKDE